MAQPVDAVALHQAHGPGIEIRPDRRGTVTLRLVPERFRDTVERLVPRNALPALAAFWSVAQQRVGQAVRVMHPLGVAGDLLADHAGGIRVAPRAAHAADRAGVENLHIERAGTRTVVRTDRGSDP